MECVPCWCDTRGTFLRLHLFAIVLLILICISAPIWDTVNFLLVFNEESYFSFGVFGYTGIPTQIGYHFPITSDKLASSNVHNLTYTLILHPIVACLSCLAVLSDLFGTKYGCWVTYHATMTLSLLAVLVAFVALVLDMILFTIVGNEFVKSGFNASYGWAMWLFLLTVIILTSAAYHYLPCDRCRARRSFAYVTR